jgi:hypothetical protein
MDPVPNVPTLPTDAVETDEAELTPRIMMIRNNISVHTTIEDANIQPLKKTFVQLDTIQTADSDMINVSSPQSSIKVNLMTEPSLKPLRTITHSPRRVKGVVAFGNQVQVVITKTQYSGEKSHLFYQLGFWVHNKVVHGLALFGMMAVLVALIVILAIEWGVAPQFQCDKPLRSILLSDTISLVALIAFLGGSMIVRSVIGTFKLRQKIRRRNTRTETPQLVQVQVQNNNEFLSGRPIDANSCNGGSGSFAGTPIMHATLSRKDSLTPKHKRDVVIVEPLKTIFNDIHKENAVQKRNKAIKITVITIWVILHVWCLCSLIYVIDVGSCIQQEPILYFTNMVFFILAALCTAIEVVIVMINL